MIILDSIVEKIEIQLAATVATTALDFTASYVDLTATSYTPAGADGTISTGTTDLVAVPGASTQRQVKQITVYNNDTATAIVSIKKNNNGTARILCKITLDPGDTLQYNDGEGFCVIGLTGIHNSPDSQAISAGTQSAINRATVVLSNSNSMSFGMNSSSVVTATYNYNTYTGSFYEVPHAELQPNSTPVTAANSMSIQMFLVPYNMTVTRLDMIGAMTLNGSTAGSMSISAAVYTRGTGYSGRFFFSVSSTFGSSSWNSGGATNNSDSYSGQSFTRIRTMAPLSWIFTPGEYWMGIQASASAPAGSTVALSLFGQSALSLKGKVGWDNELVGNYGNLSVTQSNFVDSFHVQDVLWAAQAGNALLYRQPYFRMYGTF